MMILKWTPKRYASCGAPELYKRLWNLKDNAENKTPEYNWNPTTDVFDTESEYVLRMEVPGLAKENLNIEVKEGKITISGERKINDHNKAENDSGMEPMNKRFKRIFRLPQNVDGKKIAATLKNGVLELRIPKPEEVKPRSISIH